MRVLIVAKTRMGRGACIGAITEKGESVRLIPFNADPHDGANQEYEVGDIWEITGAPETSLIPPHNENFVVHKKSRIRTTKDMKDLVSAIELLMPPKVGNPRVLYDGLLKTTGSGSLYVSVGDDVPPYSTTFWRTDQPLTRDTQAKRIRYHYPTENGGCTLTFVGFQEPLATIPTGTLLRVSLAHRWRPKDQPNVEERHYAQISGWFLEDVQPDEPALTGQAEPPLPSTLTQIPLDILKNVFGHEQFRPLQKGIIDHILKGQDALIVLPTGGGKSLCYQLPALIFDGVTVVVSPLISLMQDQVTQLENRGIRAAFLNHTVTDAEYVATMQRVRQNEIKLLYLAPETLVRPEILVMLDEADVSCLAIDEAHCISEWGHDFRPEYRQLVSIRERFQNAVCVALTATATPRVQNDIKKLLKFGNENQFIASFDRENLFITVEPKVELLEQTFAFLNTHREGSGIIYCQTKKQVESLCRNLTARRISALPYHADLDGETRKQNQDRFINGDIQVIIATIAFGMGIDKANVRFVLHAGLPKEPESYYQEIGRSGRDGLPADCLLLFSYKDADTINYFINQGAQSEKQGRQVRLQTLVSWSTSIECRRKVLLTYFGESYKEQNCGMCDNCCKVKIKRANMTIPAQDFLSSVSQTNGRFGETHIINILLGSKARKVLKNNHALLSTYGIGKEYSKVQWKHLAFQLLQHELLKRDAQYGSLYLTPKGERVLNGEEEFRGISVGSTNSVSENSDAQKAASKKPNTYAQKLFEKLQDKCKTLEKAEQEGIFTNRMLREMATSFPRTREAFAQIRGVSLRKMKKYADDFLPIIRDYCQEHGIDSIEIKIGGLNADDATSKKRDEYAHDLFEQLRDKCRIVAKTEQRRIFNERTLKEMATYFPQTEESFIKIHGVGPKKTERYAKVFLPIIQDYCKKHGVKSVK